MLSLGNTMFLNPDWPVLLISTLIKHVEFEPSLTTVCAAELKKTNILFGIEIKHVAKVS